MEQGSLAEKLRVLRARRGLSLLAASKQLGIDRHTLRRVELGVQEPQYPTLAKIAEGYGVPVEKLLEEPVFAGKGEAPTTGLPESPPQVSREDLAAEGIPATQHEVEEVNYTIADFWRLARGGKPVARFQHEDVDSTRVFMLIDLILGTPSIVTPQDAEVVRMGIRERLKA